MLALAARARNVKSRTAGILKMISSASDEEIVGAVTHLNLPGFTTAQVVSTSKENTLTICCLLIRSRARRMRSFSPKLPISARWQSSERSIQPLGLACVLLCPIWDTLDALHMIVGSSSAAPDAWIHEASESRI